MKVVHDPMQDWREHQRRRDDEDQPSIERIQPREQLPRRGLRWIDRTHTAQEHGRVQERINPRQFLKRHVANHPNSERYDKQGQRDAEMRQQTPRKASRRYGRLAFRFVHGGAADAPLHTPRVRVHARARKTIGRSATLLARRGGARC